MKRTVLAALFCIVAVGSGFAADLPAAGPPPAVRYAGAATYDWSGFYLGIKVGTPLGIRVGIVPCLPSLRVISRLMACLLAERSASITRQVSSFLVLRVMPTGRASREPAATLTAARLLRVPYAKPQNTGSGHFARASALRSTGYSYSEQRAVRRVTSKRA